jgi:RNA polymerase-binding protein DksA
LSQLEALKYNTCTTSKENENDMSQDFDAIRRRLEEERQRLEALIQDLEQGDEAATTTDPVLDSGGIPSDIADDADALSLAERNRGLITNSQNILRQVNHALERLDKGTYGTCEQCGRPIGEKRLAALPYVTLCIECQAKEEARVAQARGR